MTRFYIVYEDVNRRKFPRYWHPQDRGDIDDATVLYPVCHRNHRYYACRITGCKGGGTSDMDGKLVIDITEQNRHTCSSHQTLGQLKASGNGKLVGILAADDTIATSSASQEPRNLDDSQCVPEEDPEIDQQGEVADQGHVARNSIQGERDAIDTIERGAELEAERLKNKELERQVDFYRSTVFESLKEIAQLKTQLQLLHVNLETITRLRTELNDAHVLLEKYREAEQTQGIREKKGSPTSPQLPEVNNATARVRQAPSTQQPGGKKRVRQVLSPRISESSSDDSTTAHRPSPAKQSKYERLAVMTKIRPRRIPPAELEERLYDKMEDEYVDGLEKFTAGAVHGTGIRATREYKRGEWLVEYKGALITGSEGTRRYASYHESAGSYFFFKAEAKNYCIDATESLGSWDYGRLVNHSFIRPNCTTKPVKIRDKLALIIYALRPIKTGEELLYDYGETRPEVLRRLKWLRNT